MKNGEKQRRKAKRPFIATGSKRAEGAWLSTLRIRRSKATGSKRRKTMRLRWKSRRNLAMTHSLCHSACIFTRVWQVERNKWKARNQSENVRKIGTKAANQLTHEEQFVAFDHLTITLRIGLETCERQIWRLLTNTAIPRKSRGEGGRERENLWRGHQRFWKSPTSKNHPLLSTNFKNSFLNWI